MTPDDSGAVPAHLDPASDVVAAAELFKALASPLRVQLLLHLDQPLTVTQLVRAVGATQPLISQHLRVLRTSGLVRVTRRGREAYYVAADEHVGHVVQDAVAHAAEPSAGEHPPEISHP